MPPDDDPFNLDNLRIPPGLMAKAKQPAAATPITRKQRESFIKVPMVWWEKLAGASGPTWRVAVYLLHLHWRQHGKPFKLPNKTLKASGVNRYAKRRALLYLERLGLIGVDWRPRKSPLVSVYL